VSRAARLSAKSFMKICHQDQSDARSSSAMTACTTTAGRPSCSARQRRIRPGGSAGATRVADSPLQLSTATTA